MRLWWTEPYVCMRNDVGHQSLVTWLIFSIFVEIKWFNNAMSLWVICWLRMPIVRHRHVRTLCGLDLQLLVKTRVVLIFWHSSLSLSAGSCSCISLSWMRRNNFTTVHIMKIVSTISRWSRLKEEVVLQLLSLIYNIFFFRPIRSKRVSCYFRTAANLPVVDGCVCIALNASNFVSIISTRLLSHSSASCISHHIC